jgi:hypothetical protein
MRVIVEKKNPGGDLLGENGREHQLQKWPTAEATRQSVLFRCP